MLPSAAFAPKASADRRRSCKRYYRANTADYIRPERRVIRYASVRRGGARRPAARRPTARDRQRYQRDRAQYAASEKRTLHPAGACRRGRRAGDRRRSARRQVARRRGARERPRHRASRPGRRRPRFADHGLGRGRRRPPLPPRKGAMAAPARGGLGWYVLRVDADRAASRRARSTQARDEISAGAGGRAAPRRARRPDRADRGRVRRGRSLADVARELKVNAAQHRAGGSGRPDLRQRPETVPPILGRVLPVAFDDGRAGTADRAEVGRARPS